MSIVPRWRAFGLPKRGHTADEYEDAYAGDPKLGRFAVADGASEASFASLWANLLVQGFVHPGEHENGSWLHPLRERWSSEVDGQELSWYAEEKREIGAFATLLGLVLHGPNGKSVDGTWVCVAVGDSCVFQVRRDVLVKAFPVQRSADFGTQPGLICSRAEGPQGRQHKERGSWKPGDRFFLMTDALAQWSLAQHEHGKKPWLALDRAEQGDEAERAAWIELLRSRDGLRNDDVTLVSIHV